MTQKHRGQDLGVLHSSEMLSFSVDTFEVAKQFLRFIRATIAHWPNQYQNLLQPFVILEFHLLGKLMEAMFTTKGCCSDQDFLAIVHAIILFLSAKKEKGGGGRNSVGGSENL